MSTPADNLYKLLPALHRLRDAEQGEPLRHLLAVIGEHFAMLQEDVDRLYDDQFIETCAAWAAPYIGELIGYRPLSDTTGRGSDSRAEVANTIKYRRRKGTATVLEQLGRDVTGWDARVVEYFERLLTTQYMNHTRPHSRATVDLRDWEALERRDSAFDAHAHFAEVRRIESRKGRFNVPNVGIHLWRLRDRSQRRSPAVRIDARRFLFSPLGHDAPLFTRAESEDDISQVAEPINVPEPISRRVLHAYLGRYYGEGKSVFIEADGVDTSEANVRVCDLSDLPSPPAAANTWARTPLVPSAGRPQRIAIDPVLGRIVFADDQPPGREIFLTFHYAFGADLGGGEYKRGHTFEFPPGRAPDRTVRHGDALQPALDAVAGGGLVELADGGRFAGSLAIEARGLVEVRAAEERRPTIVVASDVDVTLVDGARLVLNGLLIAGGRLRVAGSGVLTLKHCTLVPGLSLTRDGRPMQPGEASIVLTDADTVLEMTHCICGPVRSPSRTSVGIDDCIIDSTDSRGVALAAENGLSAGGALRIQNSTVIGKVWARVIELGSNCLFDARLAQPDAWSAPVRAEQTQQGCVRFCYVPPGAVTPRRYRCQPDMAKAAATVRVRERNPAPSAAEIEAAQRLASVRVAPAFASRQYGDAAYMQLLRFDDALAKGADDESEMGAFHDVCAPQREDNLRIRLEEYLRFRLEAGIFYAS